MKSLADPLCSPAHHGAAAPDVAFDTRTQAHAALLRLVAGQSSVLWCFSVDFTAWPLQRPEFIRALEHWALRDPRRHEVLRFLAVDWSTVQRRFARFTAFRQTFAHLVACRRIAEAQLHDLHEMAWTPAGAVYAKTATWMTGECVRDPARLQALRLRLDDAWELAVPAFPASTLGL
ncbi:MAG: hypothetical protein AB7S55_05075 [Thiomonas sp.]|jgi:hypothetical protein